VALLRTITLILTRRYHKNKDGQHSQQRKWGFAKHSNED